MPKRKAFRKAAKKDIDKNSGLEKSQITQWISIDKELLKNRVSNSYPGTYEEEIDDEKLMAVFGVHQPITFYGYMNMKASIEYPISKSGDHIVEDAAVSILIEKEKRIQKLLPKMNCSSLDSYLASSDKPTVVFYGAQSLVKGNSARLSFLRHIQQANLMAFTEE